MTQLARDKYREAEYFLNRLREANGEDIFRYNLDAFLAAAHSVPEALEIDINKTAKKKACNKIRDKPLGDFIHYKRNFVIHDRPAMLQKEVSTLKGDGAGIIVQSSPSRDSVDSGMEVSSQTLQEPPTGVTSGESIPREQRDPETDEEDTIEEETQYYFIDFQDTSGKTRHVPNKYANDPVPEICEAYLDLINRVLKEWE